MYKLICIDMDGTLLTDDKVISERNLSTLKKAMLKGVKVVVCTGRLFTSANYYADIIGIKVPVIASNGAYIREKDDNKVIYESVLGEENCINIYNILKKYNVHSYYNTCDTVLNEKGRHFSKAYINMNKALPEDKRIHIKEVQNWEDTFHEYRSDILKCLIMSDELEELSKARIEIEKLDGIEVVSSAYDNFEIMKRGASKGAAVKVLADFYNISKEEVMCIGDNENDLSMINYAGLGVAMGNGEEMVKKVADYITDTNNNDGVAKAIEKFVL